MIVRALVPCLFAIAACAASRSQPLAAPPVAATPPACALPEPTVLRREGNAVLQRWELEASPHWSSDALPDAPGYHAYRQAIIAAGGDLARPVADPPRPTTDAEREVWRREDLNTAQMYEGGGGTVRPIQCLEAALFAFQDARYSELTRPTELIASILRKGDRLRVYVGASDQLFPPKAFYGFDEARADIAAGWTFWVVLHNHTVRQLDGKPALGSPAPSTNDVHLARSLVEEDGLQEIRVTNGLYTGVIRGEALGRFQVPAE